MDRERRRFKRTKVDGPASILPSGCSGFYHAT